MRSLIVGYGNPLRGDDAVGWVVATQLFQELGGGDCDVRTLHQLLPELADDLGHFDIVVFVDASATEPPGTVRVRELTPPCTAQSESFTHHFDAAKLLALCRSLWGRSPQAFLVTIGGADFGFSETLSPQGARAAQEAVRYVKALLRLCERGLVSRR
jgi:hydrogenase maturation protease